MFHHILKRLSFRENTLPRVLISALFLMELCGQTQSFVFVIFDLECSIKKPVWGTQIEKEVPACVYVSI